MSICYSIISNFMTSFFKKNSSKGRHILQDPFHYESSSFYFGKMDIILINEN